MSSQINSAKIAVFDSGLGGLTVLKSIKDILPQENLIYFGDTARVPYGNKSKETIIKYTLESITQLLKEEIKLIVIACNTASALALDSAQENFNVPIIGVIKPTITNIKKAENIGVIGTRATINSSIYKKEILKLFPKAKVTSVACPLLVPLVEENMTYHTATKLIIKDYLKPFKEINLDELILGCTHYPLLKDLIKTELGSQCQIIESGSSTALAVKKHLESNNMLNKSTIKRPVEFLVSDEAEKFKATANLILKEPIEKIRTIQNY